MSGSDRLRDILRLLPLALLLYFASKILFDMLAGRPQFWSSREALIGLAWNASLVLPIMLFALAVAQQRHKPGN